MRRVVITGLGLVSPVGLTCQASWEQILAGKSGIGPITCFDASRLPVTIAGEVKGFNPDLAMDPKEAKKASRFVQFAVAAAKEALEDSGLSISAELSPRAGTSIGVGIGAIQNIEATAISTFENGPKRISPFFIPYVITNMAAGIVANTFHLQGPNICTTTACTSGNHAVGESWLYITSNMADVMICGGSEAALCEISVGGFANMKALSRRNDDPQTASRPFDRDRDGFVMGEGAGIFVLEEYEHAKARGAKIYAEVVGYGMSGDAHHITTPPPEGEGAQRCMRAGLASAKLRPEDITYVNAHGTSTPINDLYETQAINKVFGSHARNLAVSSTKGATGHCLGAAGGIEAVVLAKAIAEQVAPPTANLINPDPACTLDYVPGEARPLAIKAALSNSFGFGGTNACIVMRKI